MLILTADFLRLFFFFFLLKVEKGSKCFDPIFIILFTEVFLALRCAERNKILIIH